jgi:hypothetical protein
MGFLRLPGFGLFAALTALVIGLGGCASSDDSADGNAAPNATEDALGEVTPGCAASANASNPNYEFQDDTCHRKVWPTNDDRTLACPIVAFDHDDGFTAARALGDVTIDTQTFSGFASDLDFTVIAIHRDGQGHPRYRYYSNGTHAKPVQPLSSTKFMAIAAAGAKLRSVSGYKVGLPATTNGIPIGDLATVVHDYNEQHYESNSLARYFLNIAGRSNVDALIHDAWLGRPAAEFLGANYGAPAASLPYHFVMPDGAALDVSPDDESPATSNNLSTLTMAEFLKRLVMHREDASTRLSGIQEEDLQVLFYGPTQSKWYPLPGDNGFAPPRNWGGMSADTGIYLQSAVDIHAVETSAHGKWRIFSKLGYGQSGLVENGYACLPSLDASGAPVVGEGLELAISTHYAQPSDNPSISRKRDAQIAIYYKQIIAKLRSLR